MPLDPSAGNRKTRHPSPTTSDGGRASSGGASARSSIPDAMQEAVEEEAFQLEIERDIREAQELGIHAVPTFLVGERHAVQGAPEAEVFRRLLRQLGARPKNGWPTSWEGGERHRRLALYGAPDRRGWGRAPLGTRELAE